MSIRERGMKRVLPLIVTSVLYLNACGRTTSVRLGMSEHHFKWVKSTLETDVTRILECATEIVISSECCEFGQV